MAKTPFHTYLRAAGPMTRQNPALVKLSKKTRSSEDHLFQVALGRKPSGACAAAIAHHVKDPAVTIDSLLAGAAGIERAE